MISVLRIGTLATNTVREAIRNKLLYTLIFFAIALIGTGVFVSALSYVEGARIMQDVGQVLHELLGCPSKMLFKERGGIRWCELIEGEPEDIAFSVLAQRKYTPCGSTP